MSGAVSPFGGHAGRVANGTPAERARTDLAGKLAGVTAAEDLDRLALTVVPLVPEVRLYLARDAIVWWARMEADAGRRLDAPYWASAWPGGQAVARYVLDQPHEVAGRRVLDLAAGSGLVGIAAALAGARSVTANDIDPYALAAIALNAAANGVAITTEGGDLFELPDPAVAPEVVLAGDVFYSPVLARRMLPLLHRLAGRGSRVLIGDPGRPDLPRDLLDPIVTYPVPEGGAMGDAELRQTSVLGLRAAPAG